MGELRKVAKTTDVAPGGLKTVNVDGVDIALYNVGGTFYATHDTCLHRGASLGGEGELAGTTVTCGWHGWEYDVTTGQAVRNPTAQLKTFPVKVEGDDILLDVGSATGG